MDEYSCEYHHDKASRGRTVTFGCIVFGRTPASVQSIAAVACSTSDDSLFPSYTPDALTTGMFPGNVELE